MFQNRQRREVGKTILFFALCPFCIFPKSLSLLNVAFVPVIWASEEYEVYQLEFNLQTQIIS
jgi:hypothetical protein